MVCNRKWPIEKRVKRIRRFLLPPPTIFLLVVEGMDRLAPPSRRQESTTVTTLTNNHHHATTTTGTGGGGKRGGGQDGIRRNARVLVVDLRDLVNGLFLVSFSLDSLPLIATVDAPTTAVVRRRLARDGKRVNVAQIRIVIILHLLLVKVARLRLRLGLGVVIGRCRPGRSRAPNESLIIIIAIDMLRWKVMALMIIVKVLRSLLPRGRTPPWC